MPRPIAPTYVCITCYRELPRDCFSRRYDPATGRPKSFHQRCDECRAASTQNMSLADRFLHYVRKSDRCWEWTGGTDKDGYGIFAMPGHDTWRAPRAAYKIFVGDPAGWVVRHTCDNTACVRPDHLILGTTADNNRDRDERGRTIKGEAHHRAKLTTDQVALIRSLHRSGSPIAAIAAGLDVSWSTVKMVIAGKTWK